MIYPYSLVHEMLETAIDVRFVLVCTDTNVALRFFSLS